MWIVRSELVLSLDGCLSPPRRHALRMSLSYKDEMKESTISTSASWLGCKLLGPKMKSPPQRLPATRESTPLFFLNIWKCSSRGLRDERLAFKVAERGPRTLDEAASYALQEVSHAMAVDIGPDHPQTLDSQFMLANTCYIL